MYLQQLFDPHKSPFHMFTTTIQRCIVYFTGSFAADLHLTNYTYLLTITTHLLQALPNTSDQTVTLYRILFSNWFIQVSYSIGDTWDNNIDEVFSLHLADEKMTSSYFMQHTQNL